MIKGTLRASDTLATVALDEGVDILLGLFGPMATGLSGVIEAVTMLHAQTEKTVCIAWPLGPKATYERCVSVAFMSLPILHLRSLSSRRLWRRPWGLDRRWRLLHHGRSTGRRWSPRAEAGTVLPEHASQRILRAAGVPVSPGVLARSEEELRAALDEVGLPVAMKAISAEITHRDVAGLVRLNVSSVDEAIETFVTISKRAHDLDANLQGVYVQQMVLDGEELLVSFFRDPTFGDMVSCGAGALGLSSSMTSFSQGHP